MLNQLMLRLEYRSDETVIGRDLYEKCLPISSRFDRAVGYFASSVFAVCPEAFHQFLLNRGRIRMVCCPVLDRSDIDAIYRGHKDRAQIVRKSEITALDGDRREVMKGRHRLLSWLVASGKLEMRIAVRESNFSNHIYHEKLGIFSDTDGHLVAFTGSANESMSGLEGNFETVDVFRSWVPAERKRVDQKESSFTRLWENETDGVRVLTFAEAATEGVLKARLDAGTAKPQHEDAELKYEDIGPLSGIEEVLLIPGDIQLREHQKEAIRNWFQKKGRGLLEMATGSGKTITALAIAAKVCESVNAPLLIVIVCPFLHLCSQWIEEAQRFGLDPLLFALDRRTWYEAFSTRLFNLGAGSRQVASVVVSNATLTSPAFQTLLGRAPHHALIIADEAHNLGSTELRNALPPAFAYRLGLSATLERPRDPEGTAAIKHYFGDVVMRYSLRQALEDGVLCQYRYFPILVPLEEEELEAYLELTRKIGRLMGVAQNSGGVPQLDILLLQRARILATARGKLQALAKHLAPHLSSTHNLIYCGDGTVEGDVDEAVLRQIDAVVRVVGRDLGMTVSKYVAETPLTRRHTLRKRFAEGDLQGLVAIRCLDEGVDIPETRRAFILASSTNPRQFIQRRGRILRRAPGKTMAEVYDFIVQPSSEETDPAGPMFNTARSLFRRELYRITEFATLAVNGPEALHTLLPIRDKLNLLDFGVNDGEGQGQDE